MSVLLVDKDDLTTVFAVDLVGREATVEDLSGCGDVGVVLGSDGTKDGRATEPGRPRTRSISPGLRIPLELWRRVVVGMLRGAKTLARGGIKVVRTPMGSLQAVLAMAMGSVLTKTPPPPEPGAVMEMSLQSIPTGLPLSMPSSLACALRVSIHLPRSKSFSYESSSRERFRGQARSR